jgi:ceramide glucosyltransferase
MPPLDRADTASTQCGAVVLLIVAAAVGAVFGIYWIAQIVFVYLHLRWTNALVTSDASDAAVPVTVIHPIKDRDHELELNLDSWLRQDYRGAVQHIFSFQDPDDAAIPVVRTLKEQWPAADIAITVNPLLPGLNGKSSNMVHAMALAKHGVVLFGDSDTRVRPDFVLKMVRPLRDQQVGVTTCGQVNIGGRDFWTRFFTFIQNCETDFNWAFLTKLGMDVGITGAAFAMRRALIEQIGGLQRFGGSLLEDMSLGNLLYREKFRIILGPFLECHVERFDSSKAINYIKRLAVGIRRHIAVEMPLFILMLSWYWLLLIAGLLARNRTVVALALGFLVLRVALGLVQRVVTMNRIRPVDAALPLFFDVVGTFALLAAFRTPYVTWRGIRYKVDPGGDIDEITFEKTR